MLKTDLKIAILGLAISTSALAAPFHCSNNGLTYSVQAMCNSVCGKTCEEMDPNPTNAGACDTANYDGFVSDGSKSYGISKTTNFWTSFSNLSVPNDSNENDLIKGIVGYYGTNAWIGIYDPLKSNSYNSVDPSRFKDKDGLAITFSNWAAGQPDNKNDNADIGVVPVNGEHWARIGTDGKWSDDGYHASYGGDYKAKFKAIAEWNGELACVAGTPKPTTSTSTGYWCSNGSGQLTECTAGPVPPATNACSAPYVWDVATQKCKWNYTATATTSTVGDGSWIWCANENQTCGFPGSTTVRYGARGAYSYRYASGSIGCNNGVFGDPIYGVVKTCSYQNYSTVTTYYCPSGGSLSGTTCTVYQNPSVCPVGTQFNTSTGQCQPPSACTAPAVWDSSTKQCKTTTTATYAATPSVNVAYHEYQHCYNGSCAWTSNYPMPYYNGAVTYTYDQAVEAQWIVVNIGSNYVTASPSIRSVGTTTYSCPYGGSLSGTTCTTTSYSYASGSCPPPLAIEQNTGYCSVPTVCPLGSYQCVNISGGVQNTDTTEGQTDKQNNGQVDSSGNCLGTIYIFNGQDHRCRTSGIQTGYTDCCQKGTTWFGLGQCRESEKTLGKLREYGELDGNCHYVGDYCAEKWPLIGCVQKKKTFCCFSSPLARIIQEGGRPQLGIAWGSPQAPNCRGFTPEEFQKIDFSKVDFNEWIEYEVVPNIQNNVVGDLQNVINNVDTNLAP